MCGPHIFCARGVGRLISGCRRGAATFRRARVCGGQLFVGCGRARTFGGSVLLALRCRAASCAACVRAGARVGRLLPRGVSDAFAPGHVAARRSHAAALAFNAKPLAILGRWLCVASGMDCGLLLRRGRQRWKQTAKLPFCGKKSVCLPFSGLRCAFSAFVESRILFMAKLE